MKFESSQWEIGTCDECGGNLRDPADKEIEDGPVIVRLDTCPRCGAHSSTLLTKEVK